MAFKKTLAQRFFNISKISNPSLTNCRISSSSSAQAFVFPTNQSKPAFPSDPDPGDNGFFRRFLQKRAIFQSAAGFRSPAIGDKLIEKLKLIDIGRDRIRLDALMPPVTVSDDLDSPERVTVEEAKKLLKLSQLEIIKSTLKEIPRNHVSYSEFVEICVRGCSDSDQGLQFAKILDDSGAVIVLGKVVFLHPDEVVKSIRSLIPSPATTPNDPRTEQLEEMEKQKSTIDKKAESLVRRELWCGLGFLIVQTAGFMRLTFWELSWDVMEPICFYVTSIYFMAGYSFFLRTSKEPSFEGFFQSRFSAKQKQLMKTNNFDVAKYNELKKAFHGHVEGVSSSSTWFDHTERPQFSGLKL